MTEVKTKANNAANMNPDYVAVSRDARFLDGSDFDPGRGGVYIENGRLYSVADPEVVVSDSQQPEHNGSYMIADRRIAKIALTEASCLPPTSKVKSGSEMEFYFLERSGDYSQVVTQDGKYVSELRKAGLTPELFRHMGETGGKETSRDEEVLKRWQHMTAQLGHSAHAASRLILPTATTGQRPTTLADQNPHRYVTKMVGLLEDQTAFPTAEVFNNAGVQYHIDIVDTEAALKASESYQAIAPILYAASLNGPFGDITFERLQAMELNSRQLEHLGRTGLTKEDLARSRQSYRYPARCVGSNEGGSWHSSAPKTVEAYLQKGHRRLKDKEIFTFDRTQGNHTDVRIRASVGKTGTIEVANYDTFGGNERKSAAFQLLTRSILVNLQNMHLRGIDPKEYFPDLFGKVADPEKALKIAHRDNMAVSENGMDTVVHDEPVHKKIGSLLQLASLDLGFVLPAWAKDEVTRSYQSSATTVKHLREWCRQNDINRPSMQAYYDTGMGVPATYMIELAKHIARENPGLPREEIVRRVELDVAQTFMRRAEQNHAKIK